MRKKMAAVVLFAANAYTITGPSTRIGGSCTIARTSTSSAHREASGTPMIAMPMSERIDWMTAMPITPTVTLRIVFSARITMSEASSPKNRDATAVTPRTAASAFASSSPAISTESTNCSTVPPSPPIAPSPHWTTPRTWSS